MASMISVPNRLLLRGDPVADPPVTDPVEATLDTSPTGSVAVADRTVGDVNTAIVGATGVAVPIMATIGCTGGLGELPAGFWGDTSSTIAVGVGGIAVVEGAGVSVGSGVKVIEGV